jgi:hypothetical protein
LYFSNDALAILDLVVGTNLNSKKVKVVKSKNNHKYKPAPEKPEDIRGIPNLKEVRKKTSVQGGVIFAPVVTTLKTESSP